MCHRDPGPNNVVFQEGRPYAFIDFDLAAPGAPLEDIGYMASVLKQQELNVHFWKTYRADKPGTAPTSSEEIQQRIDWTDREMTYTQANQAVFVRALV